jgi:hypothetical protein
MGVPTPFVDCGQTWPQPPQLFGSLVRSAQKELVPLPQSVWGVNVEHASPQLVPSHVADPPVGTGHAAHDVVPQELVDELLEHTPLHACDPGGQAQPPLAQTMPPEHALPQVPQLFESVCKFRHWALLPLPQTESGLGHAMVQLVPLQPAEPLAGIGHAEHDVTPQELVDVLLEHAPLHACEPDGQAHTPAWQTRPVEHA